MKKILKTCLVILILVNIFFSPKLIQTQNTRPIWLINQSDMVFEEWKTDVDYFIDGLWYFGLNAPHKGYISMSADYFSDVINATIKVQSDYARSVAVDEAGDLIYVFPNYRLNLELVDEGYVWEVKSPCCYSRGATFSIENSYVFIFGSQQSKWEDITYIYDLQVIKLLNHYGRDVPENILLEIEQYSMEFEKSTGFTFDSRFITGILFIGILPGIAIIITILPYFQKKYHKKL